MKHLLLAVMLAGACEGAWSASVFDTPAATGCEIRFGFSPNRGGMDLAIGLIEAAGAAHQAIDIEAYDFNSHRMARALHAAIAKGSTVRIAIDAKENIGQPYTVAYEFVGVPGVEVRYENRWPAFHEKVTLVRGLNAVEEGSMNYSQYGDTRNRENANLVSNCPAEAQRYGADFDEAWAQGIPLN